jgi:IS4 transposase
LHARCLDAEAYPAKDLAAVYHERWELEIGYDEIKTELLLQKESLRSKSVVGVYQEMWGILLAYNLVRLEMERVADEAKVEPTRISFVAALRGLLPMNGCGAPWHLQGRFPGICASCGPPSRR